MNTAATTTTLKATELRMGNWITRVFAPYGFEQDRINVQVDLEELKLAMGMLPVGSFYQYPIPLTPELLEKAGFEKWEPKGWYRKGYMELFDGKPFHWASGHNLCPDIYYLHQLQNLYFALTGNELEINL